MHADCELLRVGRAERVPLRLADGLPVEVAELLRVLPTVCVTEVEDVLVAEAEDVTVLDGDTESVVERDGDGDPDCDTLPDVDGVEEPDSVLVREKEELLEVLLEREMVDRALKVALALAEGEPVLLLVARGVALRLERALKEDDPERVAAASVMVGVTEFVPHAVTVVVAEDEPVLEGDERLVRESVGEPVDVRDAEVLLDAAGEKDDVAVEDADLDGLPEPEFVREVREELDDEGDAEDERDGETVALELDVALDDAVTQTVEDPERDLTAVHEGERDDAAVSVDSDEGVEALEIVPVSVALELAERELLVVVVGEIVPEGDDDAEREDDTERVTVAVLDADPETVTVPVTVTVAERVRVTVPVPLTEPVAERDGDVEPVDDGDDELAVVADTDAVGVTETITVRTLVTVAVEETEGDLLEDAELDAVAVMVALAETVPTFVAVELTVLCRDGVEPELEVADGQRDTVGVLVDEGDIDDDADADDDLPELVLARGERLALLEPLIVRVTVGDAL